MKKNESVNDAAAKLAALIQGEPTYTHDTAPAGFASIDAIFAASPKGTTSRQMVDKTARAKWKSGEWDRVKVKTPLGRYEYWYGEKA